MERVASRNEPNIAVIAVHGVADQRPFASAREIASLLVDRRSDDCDSREYSPFVEREISITVCPVYPRERLPVKENFWGDTHVDGEGDKDPEAEPDITTFGHEFMSELLSGRERDASPQVYSTICLEGRRTTPGSSAGIHVYELYWADLSRVGRGVVRFFGELYQLLLHLPSLGKHTISFASRENGTGPWKIYRWFERVAARLLSLVIPILNLILVALTGLVLPRMVDHDVQLVLAAVLPGVAAAVIVALAMRGREVPSLVWGGAAPVAGMLSGIVAIEALNRLGVDGFELLAAEIWALSVVVMLKILRSYDRRQKQASLVGEVLVGLATAVLVFWWFRVGPSDTRIAEVALHMAATILFVMMWTWFVWMAFVIITAAFGLFAPYRVPTTNGKRKRAIRAAWTGQFSLVLSGALFAVVTIVLWRVILPWIGSWLPEGDFTTYVGPVRWLPVSETLAKAPQSLITLNVAWWFLIALTALLLFVVAAVFAVLPSVIAEAKPPKAYSDKESRTEGVWLSRGLQLIRNAAGIGIAAVAMIVVCEIIDWSGGRSPIRSPELIALAASLLSGASGLLLVMIGTKRWTVGALSALDVLLDIDNYMREHPRESAPRALIAERYVSLLRYLCNWSDRNGGHYDAIVIVAHSQGTVITADLLRFLRTEWRTGTGKWEEQLKPILGNEKPSIPLYFFTMGSPLRQLYNLFFPHHYAWLDEDRVSLGKTEDDCQIPSDAPPDPKELGVKRWVNAYRSGDYVGRNIWPGEDDPALWCTGSRNDKERTRSERCIGRGAHTHYWDDPREIAGDLHKLLAAAIRPT